MPAIKTALPVRMCPPRLLKVGLFINPRLVTSPFGILKDNTVSVAIFEGDASPVPIGIK